MSKVTKKLILVCDEKTEQYANFLRQLISTNDDKDGEIVGVEDGSVDVAVWLDKDYVANKAQLSSKEHVLFFGDSKISRSETSSMKVKYEKYGMRYGWLGKRAMLQVNKDLLTPEDYDGFIELCKKYETEFEKVSIKYLKKNGKAQIAGAGVGGAATGGALGAASATSIAAGGIGAASGLFAGAVLGGIIPIVAIAGAYQGINKIQTMKTVRDQQYRAITVIMYIDGLSEFLEG
ncbi:MAG: hypothetical protein K5656_11290 [Lachnospiraceae bacterium]|nr:hypothetical protein [Lachnospiraceae bacterium]